MVKKMSDLISRQDAIMAVKTGALSAATIYGRTDEGSTALYETVRAIKALPSAQPECKQECMPMYANVCDTISRQAAIDALGEKPLVWDDLSDFDLGKAAQWADDVDAIKGLPPAQPQRMRGEWIEDGYNHYKAVCSECGEPCATYVMGKPRDKFCKWCGADMRGDEDG